MNIVSEPQLSTSVSARQCAVEIISQILDSKRPFDEAVSRHTSLQALTERDRNFARLLIMTCLRRLGQIDALLAHMLEKPLQGKSHTVMHVLRLGVVQLLWLETPPHAAVHAMVETVAALGSVTMKGLVNAVLKRVAKEGRAIVNAQDEAKLNTPEWIFKAWTEAYGENIAREIAVAKLSEPPLDITVKENAEEWAQKLGGTVLPTGSVRLKQAGRVDVLPGYHEGKWWVQDAAASLPIQLLGDVRDKIVFDLCAAPGGKTAQLAHAGARVIAVDQSKRRLQLLQANMERLHLKVEIVESDILKWKPDIIPDAIFLDAPCSATGTLRRHPEVILHKTKEDVIKLADIQKRLLRRVSGWLNPGGKLVYCVCSLQPEEGELQIEQFLANNSDWAVAPLSQKETLYLQFITKNGEIRTHSGLLPDVGGMDGFYAICLIRLSNP